MKNILPTLISVFIACAVFAQEIPDKTILIPVSVPDSTPGAYGTFWHSELWVHNGSDVGILGLRRCLNFIQVPYLECPAEHNPGTTEVEDAVELRSPVGAVLLFVQGAAASKVTFSNRLFELSRHTQPVGVDIPVVREEDLFTDTVRFVGVSAGTASRIALRVYDPFRQPGSAVRVEALTTKGETIAETVLPLTYLPQIYFPGFAATYDLVATFPQLHGVERYDVRVTPLTAGMRYYALMSVTDTDTQQVLLVTTKQ